MAENTNTLPEPPVPADADLRNFTFYPVDINALFGSEFHAIANDAEWRAGLTLWLKSYHQVPAGSLPFEDVALCRLAEFGRDVKAWGKVREVAMRGWYRCRDGRLYHAVVARKVIDAWEGKREQRARTEAARLAALKKRQSQSQTSVTEQPTHSVTEVVTASKGEGEGKGKGIDHTPREAKNGHPSPAADFPEHPVDADVRAVLARCDFVTPTDMGPSQRSDARTLVDALGTDAVVDLLRRAVAHGSGEPWSYAKKIHRNDVKAAKLAMAAKRPNGTIRPTVRATGGMSEH